MHHETKHFCRLQPCIAHIVAITHPCHCFALNRATVLDERENISQNLAGVMLVGQTIDDRDPRLGSEALNDRLLELTRGIDRLAGARRVRWSIDVDPVDLY